MPLSNLIQYLSGTCRYCGQNAGFLQKQHGQCLTCTPSASKR